jgi:hypothetical protein
MKKSRERCLPRASTKPGCHTFVRESGIVVTSWRQECLEVRPVRPYLAYPAPSPNGAAFLPFTATGDRAPEVDRVSLHYATMHFRAAPRDLEAWLRRIDSWIAYANSVVEERAGRGVT